MKKQPLSFYNSWQYLAFTLLLFFISTSFSQTNGFDITLWGGFSQFRTGNTTLLITSCETDTVSANHFSTQFSQTIGAGYNWYFPHRFGRISVLDHARLSIDIFHVNGAINGVVYQFQQNYLDNFFFDLKLRSITAMLNQRFDLLRVGPLAIYGVAGIGRGWNRGSYDESLVDPSLDLAVLRIGTIYTSRFAYQFGGGFDVTFGSHDNLGISLSYLYTVLGKINFPARNLANNGVPFLQGPNFRLTVPSLLLGFSIRI